MTAARVEFQIPQATGWAVGVQYAGKTNTLILSSQIHVVLNGAYAAVVEADHGVITNDPREITLYHPHLSRRDGTVQADQAVFYLSHENQVERILASGDVTTETRMQGTKEAASKQNSASDSPHVFQVRSRADQAEFLLEGQAGSAAHRNPHRQRPH